MRGTTALPTSRPLHLASAPTYWRCEPGWSWDAPPLPDWLLWYVMDGRGWLSAGSSSWDLLPGTAAVFAPGACPRARHDPRQRLLVFGMHFTAADRRSGPPAVVHMVRDQAFFTGLVSRCDASYRRGGRFGARQSQLCLEQMLCLLADEASHPPLSPGDEPIDAIAVAIRQDPGYRRNVPALARQAGLSTAQFTRRFRDRTGLPPARYALLARIERASRLLAETPMTITQIAAALGYRDTAHFTRQYRQVTSSTPGDHRRYPPALTAQPLRTGSGQPVITVRDRHVLSDLDASNQLTPSPGSPGAPAPR